jgi:Ca2+-binding RTX toxin-like protein
MQCVDLVLDKSDSPDPVNVGNEVHYRIDVINPARYQAFVPVPCMPAPPPNSCDAAWTNATGVTITDNLPSNVQFVSATPNPPLPLASCSHSAGVVTCTPRVSSLAPPGVIPPGLTAGAEITVRTTETGTITNTATVTTSSTEIDPADNSESVTTAVQVPGPPPGGSRQSGTVACKGRTATIVDEAGDGSGVVKGTLERDVIAALGGKDKVKAGGGPDLICGGPGGDLIKGARGDDEIKGGKGRDVMRGGAGDDDCKGGAGRDAESRC